MVTVIFSLNFTVGLLCSQFSGGRQIIGLSLSNDQSASGRQLDELSLSNNQSAKLDLADAMVEQVWGLKRVRRYAVVFLQKNLVILVNVKLYIILVQVIRAK